MKKVYLSKKSDFGKKAKEGIDYAEVVVGKWFAFSILTCGERMTGYGKVVEILNEDQVLVDKYFELPSYRPYAAHQWFDRLPIAIGK